MDSFGELGVRFSAILAEELTTGRILDSCLILIALKYLNIS
jgi:hypothetical protein